MSWDDYRFFLAVYRHKTLRLAGKHLNVDQATVGRRIGALQKRLGAQVLEKRADGFFLTAVGARILEGVMSAEEAMLSADRAIAGGNEKVEGVVKVAMPGALANQWLMDSLGPFLRNHPELEIQFLTGPEILNLSRREADFAIRLVRPDQKELKTKKIGQIRLGLYGAKDLAKEVKRADLSSLPFIGLFEVATSQQEKNFLQSLKFTPRYRLRSAAWSSVYAALRGALGIGILPTFLGAKDKTLHLIEEDRAEISLWLVVHPEVAESARVRATIEHFKKVLES